MNTVAFPRSHRSEAAIRPLPGLLPTKLHRPRSRSGLVARPRLIKVLEQGLWRSLTLISAPAGSGKSTLLAQWLTETQVPVGWLALDEADNHPGRFLQYLIAALHRAHPALDGHIDPLLQSAGAVDPEQLLAAAVVVPLTEHDHPLALVLDDYHVIHNPVIHRAIAWLLDHRPPSLHLILTTRHDPPLPLARLRVRDQLNEFRAVDLRFNHAEARDFFRESMHLTLSDAAIDTIERRTEGWVAALQLSALSLRGRSDHAEVLNALRGDHRLIADYLVQEVLDRQSIERRHFLLRSAVLERLCEPLCAAVTGEADAQPVLEALEADNLFLIPLDEQRRWYRYHHLFAELLRRRLEQELPGEAAALHRRASAWFRSSGLIHEAVEHARKSGDRELLVELLDSAGQMLIIRGETEALRDWMGGLPDSVYRQRPRLAMLQGWCAGTNGDYARAAEVVTLGEQGLAERNALAEADKFALSGHFTAIRSFVASCTGDPEHGLALARQALARLPDDQPLVRSVMALSIGNNHVLSGRLADAVEPMELAFDAGRHCGNYYVAACAAWCLAQFGSELGDLERTRAWTERNRVMLEQAHCSHLPLNGLVTMGRTLLAYERWDLETARREAEESLRQANLLRDIGFSMLSRLLLSRILIDAGDTGSAGTLLREAQERAEAQSWPDPWQELRATRARLALFRGELGACRSLLGGSEPIIGALTIPHHACNLIRLRLALFEHRTNALVEPLEILRDQAETEGLVRPALELRLLSVAILLQAERPEAALEQLRRALRIARSQHWRRPFAELAAWLAPLADRLDAGEREFIGLNGASLVVPGLIEPLSVREQEVLDLLARGLSNQAIAQRLFVSVGTVKTHVHNLLGKFQVGNRTEAVHRARRLGLLADG